MTENALEYTLKNIHIRYGPAPMREPGQWEMLPEGPPTLPIVIGAMEARLAYEVVQMIEQGTEVDLEPDEAPPKEDKSPFSLNQSGVFIKTPLGVTIPEKHKAPNGILSVNEGFIVRSPYDRLREDVVHPLHGLPEIDDDLFDYLCGMELMEYGLDTTPEIKRAQNVGYLRGVSHLGFSLTHPEVVAKAKVWLLRNDEVYRKRVIGYSRDVMKQAREDFEAKREEIAAELADKERGEPIPGSSDRLVEGLDQLLSLYEREMEIHGGKGSTTEWMELLG